MTSIFKICAEFIRVLVTLTRPLSSYILQFFYNLFMGEKKQLPPIESKILLMSAIELAEKIRKRQLSCEEVIKAYVARSKQIHPYINAVVDERYEDALKDARNIDKFLSWGKKSEDIARDTPLLGLPFSCKESVGVKGMKQTSGLVRYKDHVAYTDSHAAEFYRKAGAIPIVVTNVPEFCMWWESSNHVTGLTKNPYDNTRTVGGSSGGEGALITSAGSLFGVGNDFAGSVRIPASFCGIYGHKPSRGLISNWKPSFSKKVITDKKTTDPRSDLSVEFLSTGPMCRYAQDLPLLTRVLSNNDQRLQLDTKVNFRKVKVYYIEEFPGILHRVVPDVRNALRKAVGHFKEQYEVTATPIDFPELRYTFLISDFKRFESNGQPFSSYLKRNGRCIDLWWELIKCIFGYSDHTLPAIYLGLVDRRLEDNIRDFALKQIKELERKFKAIFEEDAIVLVPTHPEPPPHYLMTIPMHPNIVYTSIFNILGFPVSQIPAGLSKGVPIGIQAVGGHLKDHLCLATALELEKVFNGWISPCPIKV